MRPGVDRRRTKKAASTSGRGLGSIFKKLIGRVTKKAVGNTAKSALKRLATKKTLGSIVRIGKQALQRDPRLKQTIVKESKQVVTDVAKSILQPDQKKRRRRRGHLKKSISIRENDESKQQQQQQRVFHLRTLFDH